MVTQLNNGYNFDYAVGYKKDLFSALKVDLLTVLFIMMITENDSSKNLYSCNRFFICCTNK